MCNGMELIFDRSSLYNAATGALHLANHVPDQLMNSAINPWAAGHKMMKFPHKPFHKLIKEIADPGDIKK